MEGPISKHTYLGNYSSDFDEIRHFRKQNKYSFHPCKPRLSKMWLQVVTTIWKYDKCTFRKCCCARCPFETGPPVLLSDGMFVMRELCEVDKTFLIWLKNIN